MKESELQVHAFNEYYASRNMSQVSREIHVTRATLYKWKKKFLWDEQCDERDRGIKKQVQSAMMPQWAATKVLLVQAFLNQITAAMEAGIAAENPRDMVAVSKELRALMGEADQHEVETTVKHKVTDDPEVLKSANELAKKLSCTRK